MLALELNRAAGMSLITAGRNAEGLQIDQEKKGVIVLLHLYKINNLLCNFAAQCNFLWV